MKPTEPSARSAARRPSLFEQPDGPARTTHREIAIFAPFAAPAPASHSQRWATAGVVAIFSAFALLAGATGWALFNRSTDAPPPSIALRAVAPPTPVKSAGPSTGPATADDAAALPAASNTTARIETVPASATLALDDAARSPLASTQTVDPPQPTSEPAPPRPRVAAPVKHAATPAPKRQEADARPRTSKSKPRIEADTILLAALVSHVQHTDAAQAKAAADVVVVDRSASTADLVARCGQLGGLEGSLCRKRICKGLWGRDPACPAN